MNLTGNTSKNNKNAECKSGKSTVDPRSLCPPQGPGPGCASAEQAGEQTGDMTKTGVIKS